MRCSEFLRLYSEYRDDLITDPQVVRQLNGHLAACDTCSRYDARVREGVQALRRAAVELEPTPRFRERLRQRIASGAEPAEPAVPAAAGLAALLMLAAALALLINQRTAPAVRSAEPVLATSRARTAEPTPMVVVNPSIPFVTFTDFETPAFSTSSDFNTPITGTEQSSSGIAIDAWANLPR